MQQKENADLSLVNLREKITNILIIVWLCQTGFWAIASKLYSHSPDAVFSAFISSFYGGLSFIFPMLCYMLITCRKHRSERAPVIFLETFVGIFVKYLCFIVFLGMILFFLQVVHFVLFSTLAVEVITFIVALVFSNNKSN